MKSHRSNFFVLIVGMILGMVIMAGSQAGTNAAGGALQALPATIDIRIDGTRENIEAYAINGTTFVRLVDVGKAVDFNVYWDATAQAVQVESGASYTGKAPALKPDTAQEAVRQEIIALTNEIRKQNGMQPLTTDKKLMEAAQVRATEMAATSVYEHTRPDGSKFNTVTDCVYMGENIHRISTYYLAYYGLDLAEAAVKDWSESTGHLENMLNPEVSSIGVGISKGKNAKGEEAWYCVQLFLGTGCVINWVDGPVS